MPSTVVILIVAAVEAGTPGSRGIAPLLAILQQETWDDWQVPNAARRELAEHGDAAIEPICIALATNSSRGFPRWAEATLYTIVSGARVHADGRAAVMAALVRVLADQTRPVQVRAIAAEMLGHLGEPGCAASLTDALRDRDLRASAARALGQLKAKEAVPVLCNLLRTDLAGEERAVCVEALAQIGSGVPAELFARLAKFSDGRTQAASIDALARLADEKSFVALKALTNSRDPETARRSARAMLRCCRNMALAGDIRPLLAAGDQACQGCHAQVFADYERSAHRGTTEMMCQYCHGESVKHMEAYGKVKPDKPTSKKLMPQLCQPCHGAFKSCIDAAYDPSNVHLDHRFRWRNPWRFLARTGVYYKVHWLVLAVPAAVLGYRWRRRRRTCR